MTSDAQWMSLKEAVEFGATHEVLPKHATTKILDALQSEKIRSRAKKITRTTKDAVWADENWLLHGSDWDNALGNHSQLSIYESQYSYLLVVTDAVVPDNSEIWRAEGIQVFRQHVESLWPLQSASAIIADKPKAESGRKMKHNWPGAAGFIAAYIVENDYPNTQILLANAVKDWFEREGKAPDDREIGRFVSEVYKHRPGKR